MHDGPSVDPAGLQERAYRFALASIAFYRRLPKAPDAQVPGVQYLKSSTSEWSDYRAARRGRARPEFIAKLGTVVEEADESVGWLELMRDAGIASDPSLLAEAKLRGCVQFSQRPYEPPVAVAARLNGRCLGIRWPASRQERVNRVENQLRAVAVGIVSCASNDEQSPVLYGVRPRLLRRERTRVLISVDHQQPGVDSFQRCREVPVTERVESDSARVLKRVIDRLRRSITEAQR